MVNIDQHLSREYDEEEEFIGTHWPTPVERIRWGRGIHYNLKISTMYSEILWTAKVEVSTNLANSLPELLRLPLLLSSL